GCGNLGYMLAHGRGVAADVARAAELYQRACDGGDAMGCSNLGLAYAQGTGVPLDLARAMDLLRRACEAGRATACQNLEALRNPPPE
nr:sel1 repeat family protein [Myxococcota bacterium]